MRKPFQNATRHIGLSGLCALKGLAASNFLQTSWAWPWMVGAHSAAGRNVGDMLTSSGGISALTET